jgi:hypothetical protein
VAALNVINHAHNISPDLRSHFLKFFNFHMF